jgi:hypothetical protein
LSEGLDLGDIFREKNIVGEARERVGGCGMGSGSGLVVVVALDSLRHCACFGGCFVGIG